MYNTYIFIELTKWIKKKLSLHLRFIVTYRTVEIKKTVFNWYIGIIGNIHRMR